MRRRYSVVVRGVAGVVRDQTSQLSRHRTEAAAREAAEAERERLVVMRPEEAALYRIAVQRDDEVIVDVAVVGDESPLGPEGASLHVPAYDDLPPYLAGAGERGRAGADEDAGGSTAEMDVVADPGPAEEVPVPPAPERPPDDDVPDGPVPEDVIARFAQSLERERLRDEGRDD